MPTLMRGLLSSPLLFVFLLICRRHFGSKPGLGSKPNTAPDATLHGYREDRGRESFPELHNPPGKV